MNRLLEQRGPLLLGSLLSLTAMHLWGDFLKAAQGKVEARKGKGRLSSCDRDPVADILSIF